jgi:hypothetical protein
MTMYLPEPVAWQIVTWLWRISAPGGAGLPRSSGEERGCGFAGAGCAGGA